MKYRTLGKTGLKVSEIGFGCGNIGGLMVNAPFEERLSAVEHAIEAGINYFDTAAAYGNGQSEEHLGEVLKAITTRVIVATKFGLRQEDLGDIEGAVRRSLEASLKRLKRDSVDIFQLHTPVSQENNTASRSIGLDYVLVAGSVADALDRLRSEGLVKFTGFTGLGETKPLHQIIESRRFDLCQVYYNLLNPSAGIDVPASFDSQNFDGLIGKAARNNLGVAAIRVLAAGALGGMVSRTGHAAPTVGGALVPGSEYEVDQKRASKLGFLLKGDVSSLSQAGIRFVLGHPGVTVALVGFSNSKQIEEAVACSDMGPLSKYDLEQLHKLWATNFAFNVDTVKDDKLR